MSARRACRRRWLHPKTTPSVHSPHRAPSHAAHCRLWWWLQVVLTPSLAALAAQVVEEKSGPGRGGRELSALGGSSSRRSSSFGGFDVVRSEEEMNAVIAQVRLELTRTLALNQT